MTQEEYLACEDPQSLYRHLSVRGLPDRVWWLIYFAYDPLDLDYATPEEQAERADEHALIRAKCAAGLRFVDGEISWREVLKARFPDRDLLHFESIEGAEVHVRRELDVALERWKPGAARAMSDMVRDVAGDPFTPATWSDAWRTPAVKSLALEVHSSRPQRWVRTPLRDVSAGFSVRDFGLDPERLAILADALERAGCPAEHVTRSGLLNYWVCNHCERRATLETNYVPDRGGLINQWKCLKCGWLPDDGVRGWITRRAPNLLLTHLREPGPHYRGCWALDLVLGKRCP